MNTSPQFTCPKVHVQKELQRRDKLNEQQKTDAYTTTMSEAFRKAAS